MPGRSTDTPSRPLIFGEVLFDRFDDGSEVLGGAPLNVAWHLRGLGLDPLLITRIGEDDAGREVLRSMREADLDPAAVQSDPGRGTGSVRVSVSDGQPAFAIDPGQAWDAIDAAAAARACAGIEGGVLYHGTLALRSPESRSALAALRGGRGRIFLDVNLRDPWWSAPDVAAAMAGAAWVKLNEDELRRLVPAAADQAAAAALLAAEHDLSGVIVTRGAEGAFWADREGMRAEVGASSPAEVVDTVGAGDAFAAVCILGLEKGWTVRDMLERAAALAAAVCARRGAVPAERDFHSRFLADWR